ncbi:putative 2-dehydropantoate 2-reductase [Stratiformator vulcanicus]|uniref:2-dehydropantoate 2-reductase n=1 Tax=Stratiformator vulcanicus TaxID=2527980 RepID=A0A517QXZ9_9PLAN|nr:putative 2-dehydropantoate 2-reductase [Stratiformator vulcanicus]QDT36458.1 2-dehydropantoate 2-reductase [Stratiformator vulcanicus]
MSDRTYGIVGTGALGGYYGGLLARSGCEVHFLAHSDVDHIRDNGLKVESKAGDFHLSDVSVFGTPEEMPACDVVIVALKTTQNHLLAELLPPIVKADGCVLVLQNGLDIEQEATAVVGADRTLSGCCFLCSNKVGPGHIRHLDYGRIEFGEFLGNGVSERVGDIGQDFASATISVTPSPDIRLTRWRKLVWNIPFNGLSVALDASTADIMECFDGTEMAKTLMEEVVASAAAEGYSIDESFVEKMLEDTRKMVPYDSSMRVDHKLGRPMEVEAIFGNPVRAAAAAGHDARRMEMLYRHLKFVDARNVRNLK